MGKYIIDFLGTNMLLFTRYEPKHEPPLLDFPAELVSCFNMNVQLHRYNYVTRRMETYNLPKYIFYTGYHNYITKDKTLVTKCNMYAFSLCADDAKPMIDIDTNINRITQISVNTKHNWSDWLQSCIPGQLYECIDLGEYSECMGEFMHKTSICVRCCLGHGCIDLIIPKKINAADVINYKCLIFKDVTIFKMHYADSTEGDTDYTPIFYKDIIDEKKYIMRYSELLNSELELMKKYNNDDVIAILTRANLKPVSTESASALAALANS